MYMLRNPAREVSSSPKTYYAERFSLKFRPNLLLTSFYFCIPNCWSSFVAKSEHRSLNLNCDRKLKNTCLPFHLSLIARRPAFPYPPASFAAQKRRETSEISWQCKHDRKLNYRTKRTQWAAQIVRRGGGWWTEQKWAVGVCAMHSRKIHFIW